MDNQTQEAADQAQRLGITEDQGHRRQWGRWVVIGGLVLAALIGWRVWRPGTTSDAMGFQTQPAAYGDLVVTITATGNLQPTNQVDVGSEISGTVKTVSALENDPVTVGQVLAALDSTKLEAQVMQSRAALAVSQARVLQTEATVAEARSQLARLEKVRLLSDNKAASQFDLDAAQATLARANADVLSSRAAVDQARATLKIQETDLSKAVVRSPINGIVLARSVEPGQTVAASLQAPVLFTLAEDLTHMELHVAVDEADVGLVAKGQTADFTVDAYPERTYQALIIQVHFGSKTTDGVVTYETVLEVNNADLSLRPGMTATADIIVKKEQYVLLVPNTALRFTPPADGQPSSRGSSGLVGSLFRRRPGGDHRPPGKTGSGRKQRVWILQDGVPKPMAITIGSTDGVMTVVTGGDLTEGAQVIVDNKRVTP